MWSAAAWMGENSIKRFLNVPLFEVELYRVFSCSSLQMCLGYIAEAIALIYLPDLEISRIKNH